MKLTICIILVILLLVSITSAKKQNLGVYRVSAYCENSCCCGDWADGTTASGYVIQPGDRFVAAPREIPFGTILEIPGYGTVPVLDRGGAIKGARLDVFFGREDGHRRALEWGIRTLRVKIIGDK